MVYLSLCQNWGRLKLNEDRCSVSPRLLIIIKTDLDKHLSKKIMNNSKMTWRFGRIQNMVPMVMDHPCGPGPWTPSWTTPLFKRQRTRPKVSERMFWICGLSRYRFKMYLFLKCWYLSVSYTHLRAHETDSYLVCRLLLEKKNSSN